LGFLIKAGSVVRYLALAENARHPERGHVEARIVHSFGRADKLDRARADSMPLPRHRNHIAFSSRFLRTANSGQCRTT
jgi:hypothetical protein